MIKLIFRSTLLTLLLAVVLCGVYPAAVYLIAQIGFSHSANGGMVSKEGKVVGARLIGQGFSRPEYFHGRPSAAGQNGYDAASSSGSNLGPTSAKLKKSVDDSVARLRQENPGLGLGQVPVDLVTASASGLDPHISPQAAQVQVQRISKVRGISVAQINTLIAQRTESPQLGFLGKPVVNVLLINLDLDQAAPILRP